MKLEIRHIGSTIIEMTVRVDGGEYTEDVTDSKGKVDEALIESLREIANALELQNENIKK